MSNRDHRALVQELLQSLCADAQDPRPAPSTVVIAAHPDDEVVGAGARLPRLRQAAFAHVTDGSPRDLRDARAHGLKTREEYAQVRRRELQAALRLAGIGPEQMCQLGCVDQEASLQMADLSRRIAALLRETRPQVVMTHPYEGGHPDHDATAFAVHAACTLLARENAMPPTLIEMSSYHNSPAGIETGIFLPAAGCQEMTLSLSEDERQLKGRMLACFVTQQETLQYFPVGIERFRPAPRYDFAQPPHEGKLFYELFSWGMTQDRFRHLASQAMKTLEIEGPI